MGIGGIYSVKIHIVQKGDTLWKLSKKYGVSFEELKQANSQLSNPDMIMPGMKLKIPGSSGNVKKEMPIPGAQPNYVKEAPIQQPVQYAQPMQQQPVQYAQPMKEQPYVPQQPFVKEQIKMKEKPIVKEKPIIKEIIKEKPVPQPVSPEIDMEIDINNYYTVNMANMSVQKPPAPPVMPKPVIMEEESQEMVQPAEYVQPAAPDCIPATPIMPGTGFCLPHQPWTSPQVMGTGMEPYGADCESADMHYMHHQAGVPSEMMQSSYGAGTYPAPGAHHAHHHQYESSSFEPGNQSPSSVMPSYGSHHGGPMHNPGQQGVMGQSYPVPKQSYEPSTESSSFFMNQPGQSPYQHQKGPLQGGFGSSDESSSESHHMYHQPYAAPQYQHQQPQYQQHQPYPYHPQQAPLQAVAMAKSKGCGCVGPGEPSSGSHHMHYQRYEEQIAPQQQQMSPQYQQPYPTQLQQQMQPGMEQMQPGMHQMQPEIGQMQPGMGQMQPGMHQMQPGMQQMQHPQQFGPNFHQHGQEQYDQQQQGGYSQPFMPPRYPIPHNPNGPVGQVFFDDQQQPQQPFHMPEFADESGEF
ncbi:SafA/ExsA family spore coat assembly protein [Peribacillus cavernae]|uniref:SafA/ExsA family spore coat assembly protein n=1 Tax=Peribacillus cavernae TaxID=1674310 RepID=A0A433HHC7_9BACI|nr:SafA/ExsA family spore coat assembly protein [Peribacillus cavernae]